MATAAPTLPVADSATNTPAWKPELHDIPVTSIAVGGNVRERVEGLDALTVSVRAHGIRSPIRVADIGAGQYELVYGQRRLAAAIEAGLATIPAIVDAEQPDRRDRVVDQLIENLQRQDLNALDTAKAYRFLLDKGVTQRQLGERLGVAQPTIANTLRVLKAPEAIQERIAAGELTRSHVEAIAKLPDAEQKEVARRIVEHGLSVGQVDDEIKLARERQAQADRERDLVKQVVPKAIEKVEAASHDKAKVTLVIDNADLRAGLKAEGWTVTATGTQLNYGETDECLAVGVRWYPNWGTNYGPDLTAVCVVPEHKKARDEARRKREAEYQEQMKRDREKRAQEEATKQAELLNQRKAVVNAVRSAGAVGDVDLLRLVVVAIYGEDDVDELIERHVDEDKREAFEEINDPVWAIVSELEAPQLLEEIGHGLVDKLLTGYWSVSEGAKARLLELAGGGSKPKGKKAKAAAG